MQPFKMLINGRLEDGATMIDVINPATEELVAQSPCASKAQLDRAVEAARTAFPAWRDIGIEGRKACFLAIADILMDNADELGRLLTQEQGKPLPEAIGEAQGLSHIFRYFAGLDLPAKLLEESDDRKVTLLRRPFGAIGMIVPWNFPLLILAGKLPPALLAGNTVVLKPAPTTPLTALRFAELIRDALPAGVLNVLGDANDLGSALTGHPGIDKLSFTGSSLTGRKVMASAAESVKHVTLELGGNDAGIVLPDANPKTVAPGIFNGAFFNNGQVCIGLKRLYVHETIYDDLCDELATLCASTAVGNGLEQGVQLGPIQNRAQFEKVRALIEDARAHGTVLSAGDVPEKGYFIRPTIVRDIADDARLVEDEQFGPVLPILKYSDIEDAIARANASSYGLGGSIWSSDIESAAVLAERLDVGTTWVNKHADVAPHIPLGAAKQSGLGVSMGEESLLEFTRLHVINIAR